MEFDTVINVKEIKERAAHIMNTVVDDYKNRYMKTCPQKMLAGSL